MKLHRSSTSLVALAVVTAGCTQAGDAGRSDGPVAHRRLAETAPEPTRSHGLPPIRPGVYPAGKGTGQQGGGVASGTWTTVANTPATLAAGFALLLSDGSVMVEDLSNGGGDWWRLVPDTSGSYVNGSWTQLPSMPNGYQPLYFASALLPDGRVIAMGGEYQSLQPAWQTGGAIYDPVANAWSTVAPPDGWQTIGDAQSVVLADGRYVLANCCAMDMAVLDLATLTWSTITSAGKADSYFDEEGWTLLPSGKLLTADSNDFTDLTHAELYTPPTAHQAGGWSSAGSTIEQMDDTNADGTGSWEVGPALLRPDGTVFQSGATGHTAIYDARRNTWKVGPDYPVIAGEGQLDQADGPAALLPSGNVLVAASWGVCNGPAHFLEFDGSTLTEVARPASAQYDSSYNINLLLLPTGEILETDFSGDVEIYAEAAARPCAQQGRPVLADADDLAVLARGRSYDFSGLQLHGLSSGVSYGDDAQAATNYPIVRITNRKTGHVGFGRTHGFSSFSIAPGAWSKATLDVPETLESGDSDLVVIANGIASAPTRVRVR
jgi:hypothetical protein